MENVPLSVSDFIALTNQTLEYAYPVVAVVGEVSEFKISQGKWVSFKLKDQQGVVNCFIVLHQMRTPIHDGMKVLVTAAPKLNPRGYFNLVVRSYRLVGEGSIKKGFELLKAKLDAEGLFSPERKRSLPETPAYIGLITSTESAAYADFCKILDERWGGLRVEVAHTQVQGEPAADQMIRAITYFNNLEHLPEVLVVIRGGGSAEDLQAFNDELLARALAASRIPTLVGVGHEIDHTLADMVADKRAATPTNAAELVVPDKQTIRTMVRQKTTALGYQIFQLIDAHQLRTREQLDAMHTRMKERLADAFEHLAALRVAVAQVNPDTVLKRGYAMVRGEVRIGARVEIETYNEYIEAEVKDVRKK